MTSPFTPATIPAVGVSQAALDAVAAAGILGPYTVTWDMPGIDSQPGVLLAAVPAGTIVTCATCILTQRFSASESIRMDVNVQYGDLHDYWYADQFEVGSGMPQDGMGGSPRRSAASEVGGRFATAGNLRVYVADVTGEIGAAYIYVTAKRV